MFSLVVCRWMVAGQMLAFAAETTNQPPAAVVAPAPLAVTNPPPASTTNAAPAVAPSSLAITNPAPTVAAEPPGTNTTLAPGAALAGTVQTAEIPGSERNIRFHFDGIPYVDVVARFAQMVNKPLMTDTKVEGTLTFVDPQPYNYAEAMETLNLILSMKGVLLMETDRYLRLVPLKDLSQMPLRLFRGLEQTGDVRPGEVVTVVLALKNLESTEIAQAVASMLSNTGSIAPLTRGRGMIITDRLANIKRIRDLLAEIDTASPVQRQMKTYTLLHSSGAVVSDLINKTFGIATAPRRVEFNQNSKRYEALPPDPSDYVTAVFDDASRTLVLYGPAERVTLAETLITRFEDQEGARAGDVRIFYPQSTSAQELARMIRQAVSGVAGENENPAAAATKARLIVDPATNRLIVTAPIAGQLESIENLVRKIDVPAEGGPGSARFQDVQVTKVFRCRSADPDSLVRVLTEALGRPGFRARSQSMSSLKVTVDSKSRSVVLTGTPGEVQQAEEIIKQLDSDQPVPRFVRIVALKAARALDMSTKLRQLYLDQTKSQPALGPADTLILPDEAANRLILTGTEAHLKLIEQWIGQLDIAVEAAARQLKAFPLKYTSANAVASMLSQLYYRPYRMEDPTLRVVVTASPDDKTVLVEAVGTTLKRIEDMIQTLDVEPARGAFEVRTYRLSGTRAAELAPTLSRIFSERQDRRGRESTTALQPRFEADALANVLLVAATKEQFPPIEQLIKEVGTPAEAAIRQLKPFPLKYTSAASVAAMLSQLYSRPYRLEDPAMRVMVTAAPDDKTVLVEAVGATLKRIEDMIKMLDIEPTRGAFEVRTYHLTEGNAAELAPTLARLFSERQDRQWRESATALQPRFEADATANVLLVAATPPQFVQIDQLIKELRAPAQATAEIRTFRLQYTTPEQMILVLETMLRDEASSRGNRPFRSSYSPYQQRGLVSDLGALRLAAAPALNAIVVQGPPHKLTQAEQLIATLDKPDSESAATLQTVHLKKAQADAMADAINRALDARGTPNRPRRVNVTSISASNSLLVNGPPAEVREVLQIIRDLDVESASGAIEIHIYKLENGNAQEISRVLSQLLQNLGRRQYRSGRGYADAPASVTPDERTNSLIVSATPEGFKVIDQLLPTLDRAPERSDRDVNFFWLQNASASDVITKLRALFADRSRNEQPVIEADSFSNSITVIAKRADLAEIEDVVKRLDETAVDNSLQVRLVALNKVPAAQMAAMLKNIYSQMSQNPVRIVEKLAPHSAPKTSSLSIPVGSSRTNTLPATAPDDSAHTNRIEKAEAGPGAAERPLPEVMIAVDKTANALILSGPAHELDQLQSIITDLSLATTSEEAEFRQFILKEADPVATARILNELFRQEPVRVDQGGQPARRQQQGEVPRVARNQPQPGQPTPGQMVVPPPRIAVVAEPRTRSLIIRAKPAEFLLLESLIKQLDVTTITTQLAYRLVPLHQVHPDKLLPLVNQMVSQLNLSRPGDPVTVMKDPRGQALFVVARSAVLDQIEEIITELDTPAAFAEAEVVFIPLKNARAPQLAAILQEMLKPAGRGELTVELRELQEQVRRLKIQNDRGEPVVLDLTKPIKIMADPLPGSAGVGGGSNRLIITSTADNLKALGAVAAMMDTVPLMEGITARLVHLKYASANTAAQTLNSIFQQGQRLTGGAGPAERVPGEGGGAGRAFSSPLNVAVDQRSNTLILSGREETLALAQTIIEQLDHEFDTFITEIKLFRLKYASASRLAPLLQSVFAESRSVAGTEGLRTQVTRLQTVLGRRTPRTTEQAVAPRAPVVIQADDTTNILIVAARSDTMPLIEDVITTMDIPAASGLATIRLYPLQHADATTLQRVINDLYRGANSTQIRAEDKPNLSIDERTNTLIVSGNDNVFAIIASLVDRLDKDLPLELRDIHILPLANADAVAIAASLQRLLDDRSQQRPGTGRAASTSASRPVIIGDLRTNSLLVRGPTDGFELIKALALELDKAAPALSSQIRLVPLKFATAQTLSTALVTLFNQRSQASRTPDLQRNRPIIIADPRSNSLLVAANVEDNQALDALLVQLDRKPENPALSLTVIGLRHNDSAKVATMMTTIFAVRRQSLATSGQPPAPQEQVFITADPLTNSLIVSANPENLDLVKGLLEKIDVPPVAAEGLIQTFTLQRAEAQRAATMLRSLVDQGLYRPGTVVAGRGAGREAIAVTVDQRSNTLIVSASPENLLVVKELIKQIDSQDYADSGNIQLFTLKYAKASQLATVLEQFFRAKRAGESTISAAERSVPVTVTPDDRTNTLLVTGGKETFAAIERMIEQLDAQDILAKTSFKVFTLKQATAAKLQATLTQLFARRPAVIRNQAPEPITVVADSWANALVIGAAPEDMPMIESLVAQLDSTQPEAGMEVQVMPLVKADARRVALTVQALYRTGTTGIASPVTVNVDERLNALVVSAGQADIKRIAELVKKLDTDQVAQVAEIRIFPLQHARATALATILTSILNSRPAQLTEQSLSRQSLLQFIARSEQGKELLTSALKEGILITPDPRTNSLIISAPVDYMQLLEQLINRLDETSPQIAKIQVFNLKNADARQMAIVLTSVFRLQPTAATAAGGRSIQYALAKPANGSESTNAVDGASAVVGSAEESALTVTVDLRTNSLLIGGTEHYVNLATQIINTLDTSPAQERQAEVYRLKNSRAAEIELALRTFLEKDRQQLTALFGTQAMAQEILDREVSIVAEPTSNTLLISATPRNFQQVRTLIEQLDQPQLQVLIQVLLAEVTLDAGTDLGVEWTYIKDGDTQVSTGTDFGVKDDLKALGGFSSAVTGSNFNILLRAMETEGRLQVLSRPQILAADNQEAIIKLGQQVPLITGSTVTPQGGTYNSVQYTNVGVTLTVTPRISPDGYVKMDVGPKISQLTSSDVSIGQGARAPIINERSATTRVSVQSGQSIVIGGLISTVDDFRTRRTPFLGKIPVLGIFFRSTKKTEDRKELLIVLTPQVLMRTNEVVRMRDAQSLTREHLDNSTINEEFNRDPLQRQILDPLYPRAHTNAPNGATLQMPASSPPKRGPSNLNPWH